MDCPRPGEHRAVAVLIQTRPWKGDVKLIHVLTITREEGRWRAGICQRTCSEAPGAGAKGRESRRGLCTLCVCVFGFGHKGAWAKRMVREEAVGTGPLGSEGAIRSCLPGVREWASPKHLARLDCQTCCPVCANLGRDPGSVSWDQGPVDRVWGSNRVLEPEIPTCR